MPDKFKHFPAVLLLLTAFVFPRISAQNQTNNYGREFRFAFLENYTPTLDKVSFAISLEKVPTTVTISCGSYNGSFFIRRTDTVIDFLKFGVPSASNFDHSRSILITANFPVALYAMNNASNSSDISAITPSERIPGNPEYFINTYRGDESLNIANNSLFSIVAIDDSCYITIISTADSKNNLVKNIPYSLILRKGQVYEEKAMDSQSFAGTRIWNTKGCKRFSVFEGAMCSYVEYNNQSCQGCDHLYSQSRPVQYLGKNFTTLPYAKMGMGYVYQVVATENNTNININGIFATTLNKGGVYQVNQTNNVSVCIQADKLISVVELLKSKNCNGNIDNLGNPSLMTVVPDDQLTTKVGFSFPNTSNISQNPSFPADYYIGLVFPIANLSTIKINGINIDTAKFTKSCNNYVGSIKANPSVAYQITSTKGFLAYMYAYGKDESYATEIGSSFESKQAKLSIDPNTTSVCDTLQVFKFVASSDSLASYKWNFGDGTSDAGDTVSKSFNKTGKFNVRLSINYPGSKGCSADTVSKIITVNNRPYFTLGKDTNICQGIFYQIAPISKPKTTYRWSDNTTGSTLTVSSTRTVWLTITDSNLCQYTDTLNVRTMNCDTNSVIIPNVFTPGSNNSPTDDINDLFETKFSGFNSLKGKIFDRWGMVVYSFDFPQDTYWNGGVNNDHSRPCPSGTYYYIFDFENTNTNFSKTYNGVVQLIR